MTDVAAHNSPEWYADVPRSIRKQTLAGLALLALCFGGFGTWATTAPLAAAVITQGSFVATGQNKIVQHLEGGIIKELLVSEGDVVKVNQPLLTLDETAARVNERQFFLRRLRLEGIVARLSAEAAGMTKVSFPKIMQENRAEEDVAAIIASQELNFQASRGKLDSEIGLLDQNIKALEFRATGYQQQWDSMERQLRLLNEEYTGKKILSDQGLLRKTELKAIQRAMADAEGQMGRLSAEVSETNAQITKHHQQVVQTVAAYKQAALDELQSVEAELDSVRQQSHEAENVLDRATIHAPVAGTVVRMLYHTSGGVIESGKSILEILPADVPLVIETQVPRTEIDTVRVGQKATIQLIALNRRTTPVLNGEVYYVSADSLPDTSGDQNREVYLARVKLAVSELARVPGFSPTPGMPVEIMIQTAERTFFSYLAKPVTDSMSRAFMEQ
ncbi:HlyD family type I secretion periplasmic adaptor subunit [Mesorhizobium sp. DCY119]|uniref:HlyD family type I secretion periplasmic adaptor subunit n=1 Tax=Mesorhizobium sp. DCY119 TaxID=2108445 RepID=UPI000E7527B9|nr:HlyD family type I secretion periplasmic adaptor subunit [Mesorhizobium sp. DCY119]RJG41634.1 HlyD family type I secretion periplasmic adaptor subunit [Mesorhizobium sp. DCY119]